MRRLRSKKNVHVPSLAVMAYGLIDITVLYLDTYIYLYDERKDIRRIKGNDIYCTSNPSLLIVACKELQRFLLV